jgi:hypothetical protein
MEESQPGRSFAQAQRFLKESDPVEDILVLGYVDRDVTPPRFQMFPTVAALESSLGFLTLTWNHSGRFTLHLLEEIAVPQELAQEPSIEPMYASVAHSYRAEGLDLNPVAARLIHDQAAPNEYVAAWFGFGPGPECDTVLFVDAVTSSGLAISAVHEIGYRPKTSTIIDGDFVEHQWSRSQNATYPTGK